MKTDFDTVVYKMVEDQGIDVLFNSSKCKALLADYSRGDYKKEQRLFMQCIEIGIPRFLKEAFDINSMKPLLTKRLYDEYFISEDIGYDIINLFATVFQSNIRNNQRKISLFNKIEIPCRTLVLFFVIDSSSNMAGAKIGAVNTAMQEVIPEIRSVLDGETDIKIKIAVLSYSSGAKWLTANGPIDVNNFSWNFIDANGARDIGSAFYELNIKLSREPNGFMHDKDYFAPVIFLLCNGSSTDYWKINLNKLKENKWFKASIKIALAIGDDADRNLLKEFTGSIESVLTVHNVFMLRKMIKIVEYDE